MIVWWSVAALATEPATPPDCAWIRRVGSSDPVCQQDGVSRSVLGATGTAAAGAGAWWFLVGGDTYRSGDPAAQSVGIGLVGVGGALMGAFADLTSKGRDAVDDRPARPTARVSLGLGGASALDERRPVSPGFALDPTLRVSDVVQIQPHLGVNPGLEQVDVDPRPQFDRAIDGQVTTFPIGRTLRRSRVTVGAEATFRVRRAATVGVPRFSLRWRPTLEVRTRTRFAGRPDVSRRRHVALLPATVGFRWAVTPRQRFTAFVGPRLDWVSASTVGSTALVGGAPIWGSLYAEAFYQIDVPIKGRIAGFDATSRVNFGYVHSNLDGESFDRGAIIGFFGPVETSVDLRLRRPDAPIA
ncbi:MAG: hypothetical protein AAF602_07735 [Myxococcota bacterium]